MEVTLNQLAAMAGKAPNDNMKSVQTSLAHYGATYGLDRPHRVAQFLAQVLHESGDFRYDREVWGPTKAQEGYDTRTDLGNTAAKDGDGKKNAGRGPIQLTGGANIEAFYDWCVKEGFNPPNFPANPDLINTDPWEGLSAIWYWSIGNPTHRSLNVYADEGNIEQITKKVNGRLNGYADRLAKYVKVALILLGYSSADVKGFQKRAQSQGFLPKDAPGKPPQVDGDAGPKTRSALHRALVAMDGQRSEASPAVKAGPVVTETTVEVEKPVAVAPAGATKRGGLWGWGTTGIGAALASIVGKVVNMPIGWQIAFGVLSLAALLFLLWKGEIIVQRVKSIVKEIET